jgi:hypothetical protein
MSHRCIETIKVVHVVEHWSSYKVNDISDSKAFEAAGYSWFLRVYPRGKPDNTDFLSIYLYCLNPPDNEELSVKGRLQLFSLRSPNNNKTICRDFYKQICRATTKAWGWRDFVLLSKVLQNSNGFIRDDSIVVTAKLEIYTAIHAKDDSKGSVEYAITDFSTKTQIETAAFSAGGHNWILRIYPKGTYKGEGSHLSMYLQLEEPIVDYHIVVKAKFAVVNQNEANSSVTHFFFEHIFSADSIDWGICRFAKLTQLVPETGGCVRDTVIVRAEVEVIPPPSPFFPMPSGFGGGGRSAYLTRGEFDTGAIVLMTSERPQSESSGVFLDSRPSISDSQDQPSIVKLNVGGQFFQTTRSTLVKYDSMLSTMFSGRHVLMPTDDGCYFIDRSGRHFDTILNFMRDGRVSVPRDPVFLSELLQEAEYYCLQVLIDAIEAAIHD